MGMTIDESLENLKTLQVDYQQFYDDVWQDPESLGIMAESLQVAIDTMRKYQQLQADYETRLKADMVAMLIELQLEIEKIEMYNNVPFGFEPVNKFYEGVSASSKLIKQKINDLVGENGNT